MTRRSGSFRLLLCAAAAAATLGEAAPPADKKQSADMAVVAGSVFREPGFALAGAEVSVAPATAKGKTIRAASDSRGEFAVRVPSISGGYNVVVKAGGFQSQTKAVAPQPGERVDLIFRLAPSP